MAYLALRLQIARPISIPLTIKSIVRRERPSFRISLGLTKTVT